MYRVRVNILETNRTVRNREVETIEGLLSNLLSFGPRLSHVFSKEAFFVIKVVILKGLVPLGPVIEVKDCIEFGIFGTNKTRLSAKRFFFTEKVTRRYRTKMLYLIQAVVH